MYGIKERGVWEQNGFGVPCLLHGPAYTPLPCRNQQTKGDDMPALSPAMLAIARPLTERTT